ncbi:MAG TPA: hypothetical protein VFP09_13945, partial [Desertimonas sp.]|nr:hypothetical protein [Desertimonas sp.]
WKYTLDPTGPQYDFVAYAREVGRDQRTIRGHAHGYELFAERKSNSFTIQDAIVLARQSVEDQAFSEAIAEGSGERLANVARSDNSNRRDIVHQARERAGRRGTDPIEEARDIAKSKAKEKVAAARHRNDKAAARGARFISIEGYLAGAKTKLMQALKEAESVGFSEEEMTLLRTTIANIKAILDLLDLRMGGATDIDWDAELTRLTSGGAS